MRKFKFMSKAVVGMMAVAMTMGSLSGLGMREPIAVYAEGETQTASKIIIRYYDQVIAPGEAGSFVVEVRDKDGKEMSSDDIEWSVSGGQGESTKCENGELTVDEGEKAKELTVTAKLDSATATCKVIVGRGAYLHIDYTNMTGSITSNDEEDTFFFLEVLKDDKGEKAGTPYCYEGFDAEHIDLSFLKLSKEGYVRVYSDKHPEAVKIYTVAKQPKKPAVKYVAGQDSLYKSFQLNKSDLTATTVKTLQWKTQYGSGWLPFEKLEGLGISDLESALSSLSVAGSTILVRQVSEDASTPPTAEVKVKIAAIPKAPKVTKDYAKDAIKLPKTSEIRVPTWNLPGEAKMADGSVKDNPTPFYYTVGSNKDDLNVAPMVLAENLINKYIEEYNSAYGKLTDTAVKAKYTEKTKEDTKDTNGNVTKKSDKTKWLEDVEKNGFSFLVRTAAGKKAASQPTFVDVKAATSIGIRTKEVTVGEDKKDINENVIAVMVDKKKADGTVEKDDEGNTIKVGSTDDYLSFEYKEDSKDATKCELTLKPTVKNGYTFSYSLDGGAKFSKLSKDTTIKQDKIDKAKGVIVRTEGSKEDAKKKIEGNWASNEITLPVSVLSSGIEIKGDKEIQATNDENGVKKTYTAAVKDALGNDVKVKDENGKETAAKVKWSGTGIDAESGELTVAKGAAASEITITATYTDPATGIEVKNTYTVSVKAAPTPEASSGN